MVEHFNAAVDIGTSGGVLDARFVRMPSGWHCQAVGPQVWEWEPSPPCGEPKDALKLFADRWLGLGQGIFCSVLTIARDDATSAKTERTVTLTAAPRRPKPIARPRRSKRESSQTTLGRKIGRLLATKMRWQFNGN